MEVLHGPLEKAKPRQELHLLPHSMEKPSLVTAAKVSTSVDAGFRASTLKQEGRV